MDEILGTSSSSVSLAVYNVSCLILKGRSSTDGFAGFNVAIETANSASACAAFFQLKRACCSRLSAAFC